MIASTTQPNNVSDRWELSALAYVFTTIFLIGTTFIYITYKAGMLIGSSSINSVTYFETHVVSIIPEIILWAIIAKAAFRLKSYTRKVQKSDDGQALDYVANALLLALLYAVIFGMASTIKTLYVNTSYLNVATTISNIGPMLIILVSSIYLYVGSYKLNQILSIKFKNIRDSVLYLSISFYLTGLIAYAFYFHHVAPTLIDDDGLPHFALRPNALLVVYVLPYAVTWLLVMLACLNLANYSHNINGKIYKPLFRDIYLGLTLSFIGTYLVQLFDASTFNANRFGVGLFVLIGLIILLIRGCYLVYRGTNHIYKLEL